jgi:hypothetical protein
MDTSGQTPTPETGDGIAMWVVRNGRVDLDLYGDEAEAAHMAAFYLSGGTDDYYEILGLQYPDGRLLRFADWDISAALARQRELQAARLAAPPLPRHLTRDPFTGAEVWIHDSDPAWLGTGEILRRMP